MITINFDKAKQITKERLRQERKPLLEQQDILFQKQVDYWKNKVDEILVSPFNYDTWSSL